MYKDNSDNCTIIINKTCAPLLTLLWPAVKMLVHLKSVNPISSDVNNLPTLMNHILRRSHLA